MQIKHAEIEVLEQVRKGAPVEALDPILERARAEFPLPGKLLMAIAVSDKCLPPVRSAMQEVLETCWSVIEFHDLLRLEEDRKADAAHVGHARRMLGVWLDKLTDSLGPRPDEPEDASSSPTPESGPGPEESVGPSPIPLGALAQVLDEEEAELVRSIAMRTGYLPGIELRREEDGSLSSARGSFVVRTREGVETRAVTAPAGVTRPQHYVLSAILRYLEGIPGGQGR